MNIDEIEDTIIPFLESKERYSKLISLFQTQKTKGYAFELYFAYAMERENFCLEYEQQNNLKNQKTVDFKLSHKDYQLWFELVSPEKNLKLKENIKAQHEKTEMDGISSSLNILSSDDPDLNFNPNAQLIRVQEKILEKASKFSPSSENTLNIILVDCSSALIAFDQWDFRNLAFGYSIPDLQASLNNQRIMGLFEKGQNRRGSSELQKKIFILICFSKVEKHLFTKSNAYITFNPLASISQNDIKEIQEIFPSEKLHYIS